jgi:hypothetical protein
LAMGVAHSSEPPPAPAITWAITETSPAPDNCAVGCLGGQCQAADEGPRRPIIGPALRGAERVVERVHNRRFHPVRAVARPFRYAGF